MERVEAEHHISTMTADILDAITDYAILQIDLQGRIVSWNRGAQLLTGWSSEEIVGKEYCLLFTPEDRASGKPEHILHDILENGRFEENSRRLKKDGVVLSVHTIMTPIKDAGFVEVIHDITEQIRVEEGLLRSEERLRLLADISANFVKSMHYPQTLKTLARSVVPMLADWCVIDMIEDGSTRRMAIANSDSQRELEAWQMEKRYPFDIGDLPEEVKDTRFARSMLYTQVTPQLLQRFARDADHLQYLLQNPPVSVMVVPLKARGKMMGVIILVMAESGRHFNHDDLVLVEDLVHRAALAVDNAKLYKRAQEALSLRDDFLSIASHELKTPVTSIKAFLQALEQRMRNPEHFDFANNAQYMQLSIRQVDRLATIINDLLDINRISKGTLEYHFAVAPLGPIIAEVVERMSVSFPSHRIACKLQDLTMKVKIDLVRFEQALTNLITNAVKYSPAQSTIDVVMRNDGKYVYIAIVDRGMGIPKEQQAHIFDPYYRAPGALTTRVGGLGIGLFVSMQLIKAHGGQLTVDSDEGKGSTFTIRLPCRK